jgi:hypothetical protein
MWTAERLRRALLALLCWLPVLAAAQEPTPHAPARQQPDLRRVQPGHPDYVALRFELHPRRHN